jgi:serine/threonine protein kinase/outer membrane protein assembly factor BamD (BamD/ComL family)
MSERAGLIAELVKAAAECEPPARQAFLDQECGPDSELRAEVESLLEHQAQVSSFIETPALHLAAETLVHAGAFGAGQKIGHYEIVSLIGKGGMGEVYLAQDQQLRRRVALKLVRRGMDTEAIVRRFHHEQQLLAGLNHPNIAQLYDSGITPDGIPFFAMEYIDGTRVDDYCREKELPIEARLELFGKVCRAVHYAHQHLVVHRDIKPSNIVVTDEGEPKLLDFGIAKLLDTVTNTAPEQTVTLQNVLTPEYASPEHVRGDPITTASDVYSLGVLLYELLTETKPYRIESRTPVEIARIITEREPDRPSTAVTKAKGNPQFAVPNPKSLRGDLDNIVLMAMRKEPERRYSSVAQFSGDIRRHLDGLPVGARKDTVGYRSSKFIRRHRVGVAAAAMVILAVFVGLTVSIQQMRAARREKGRAEAVSKFLKTTLFSSNPNSPVRRRKTDASLKDVLDDASKRLAAGELTSQPEVRAELQRIMGETYISLGRVDEAERILTAALSDQTAISGNGNLETLKTGLLVSEVWTEKGDYAKAESFYQQNFTTLRTYFDRGAISADYLIGALYNLSLIRRAAGDSKAAEMALREIMTLEPQANPEVRAEFPKFESVLALAMADQGKFDDAEKILTTKIALFRQKVEDASDPGLAANLSILGGTLLGKKEYAEAEANLREAEAFYRKIYDPDFRPLGDNLRVQAQLFYEKQEYAEAEAKINECLKIYHVSATPSYINYATAGMIQGMIYGQTGRPAEAEKLLREAVQLRAQYSPNSHFLRAVAENELGQFLAGQKRFDEAEALMLSSYESLKNSQAPNSPRVRTALERLVAFYTNWGKSAEANKYKALLAP